MGNFHTANTDHPECVSGSISSDALRYVMKATEIFTANDEIHTRQLRFTCSLFIKKWTIGISVTDNQHSPAQILTIKQHPLGTISKRPTVLTVLSTTSYLNVYEHTLSNQEYIDGQNNSIAVNSSQVYYQRCIWRTASNQCVSRPLVAVDVKLNPPRSTQDCVHGFLSVEELREKARYIPNFAQVEDRNMFRQFQIEEDGYVVKCTFTATKREQGQRAMWTELCFLFKNLSRSRGDGPLSGGKCCLNTSESVETGYPNVYELTVNPPLPVKTGDFVAINQPSRERAGMLISFVHVPKRINQEIDSTTSGENFYLLPLVHLEIGNNNISNHNINFNMPFLFSLQSACPPTATFTFALTLPFTF